MTNIIFYIQLLKTPPHVRVQNDTVYVDGCWYRKLCNKLNIGEWGLDKHIHEVTQCKYFSYTHGIMTGTKWEWDEQEQRYK
jgi:hypothetical protein